MRMTCTIALLLLWVAYSPRNAHADPGPASDHMIPGPTERLDSAVRLYQTGQHEEAKRVLASLVNDPGLIDEGLRQRARIYLGEVLYLQGNKEETRRLFEAVLTQDPAYVIDPFAHPPDVCGFFETIRAYIRPSAPPKRETDTQRPPTRPPLTAYAGFGIYQFQSDRPVLGTTMAATQATLGALSIASFAGLASNNVWETDDQLSRLNQRRTLQWGATAGFYAVWIWGVIDAHRHWRKTTPSRVTLHGGFSSDSNMTAARVYMTIPTR